MVLGHLVFVAHFLMLVFSRESRLGRATLLGQAN
jgi:hypothetical protein